MSITTLDQQLNVQTASLEALQHRSLWAESLARREQIHQEDHQNMKVMSRLLIRFAQGERDVAEPLPEIHQSKDRLEVARHMGMTLIRKRGHQVLCVCLDTLAVQPSLIDLLSGQARKEGADVIFAAESDEQKQNFAVISRLKLELPEAPVIGIGEAAHLRYLPQQWQEEIALGLSSAGTRPTPSA